MTTQTSTAPITSPWLTIIGIGEQGYQDLPTKAKIVLKSAKLLLASERQLALIPNDATPEAKREHWPSPMQPRLDSLKQQHPKSTVIIATGDPLCWGIAEHFSNHLSVEQLEIIPAPSIITLVAAKMHWPSAAIDSLSLCSQPIEVMARLLEPGKKLIILSASKSHPAEIASQLIEHGYSPSKVTILENLASTQESITHTTAKDLTNQTNFNALTSLAITLIVEDGLTRLTTAPGLPNDAFDHDGQMTKQNIRAITLAHLRPSTGEILWDIGCGNGSISIEWLRAAKNTKAIGIEKNQTRIDRAKLNAIKLGVPELEIMKGTAPTVLSELPQPDAIFIGGGITAPKLLETALTALKPGGRLVANTVTIEGESQLLTAHHTNGGMLSRIALQQASPVGRFSGWRPAMPITQWVYNKPK